MSESYEIWGNSAGVLYDLDWVQCRYCRSWHQVSEEFLELVNEKHEGETGVIAVDPEGTTGSGSHCPDCGGVMGRWIPAAAIGSRSDGTYIFPGDPEDPNKEKE